MPYYNPFAARESENLQKNLGYTPTEEEAAAANELAVKQRLQSLPNYGTKYKVERVIDGDTVKLEGIDKPIRLKGYDTYESTAKGLGLTPESIQNDMFEAPDPSENDIASHGLGVAPETFQDTTFEVGAPDPRADRTFEKQRLSLAISRGVDPETITRKDVYLQGKKGTSKVEELIDGQEVWAMPESFGEGKYGRNIGSFITSSGKDISTEMKADSSVNSAYRDTRKDSFYNNLDTLKAAVRNSYTPAPLEPVFDEYRRPVIQQDHNGTFVVNGIPGLTEQQAQSEYDRYMKEEYQPHDTEEFLLSSQSAPTGDFARGLGQGVEGTKATYHAARGLLNDAVGDDTEAKEQFLIAQGINKAAQDKYSGRVNQIEDIASLGDVIDWAQYQAGKLAPDIAIMSATSGTGGLAAQGAKLTLKAISKDVAVKAATKKAELALTKGFIGRNTVGRLAGKSVAELGSGAGMVIGSGALESGNNWMTDVGNHGVEGSSPIMDAAFGAASGTTELVSPLKRIMPFGSGKAAGNILVRTGKGTVAEAGQEVTQELIGNTNQAIQDKSLAPLTDKQARSGYLNAAATGGLFGGMSGPLTKNNNAPVDSNKYKGFNQVDKHIRPVGSQLDAIDPELGNRIRDHEASIAIEQKNAIQVIRNLFKKINELPEADRARWDKDDKPSKLNLHNELDSFFRQNEIADKFGFRDELDAYNKVVGKLDTQAESLGIDVLADRIERDIKSKKVKGNLHQLTELNANHLVEEIYDYQLQGLNDKIEAKQKILNNINSDDPIRQKFSYGQDADTLKAEIESLQKEADAASIYSYVESQDYTDKQKDDAYEILSAYFEPGVAGKLINGYRAVEVIDTLGSIVNAISQLDDLATSAHTNGKVNVLVSTIKRIVGKGKLKKHDIGIDADTITADLRSSMSNKAVSKILKATGLIGIDSFGKGVNLDSALMKFNKLANKNPGKLRKELTEFLPNSYSPKDINNIIKEFKDNTGELSDDALKVLYHNLLKTQVVGKSQVPYRYLKNPSTRIFYLLKMFVIKRVDLYRKDAFSKMKSNNPSIVRDGIKQFTGLTSLLLLGGAGVDEIKSLMTTGELKDMDDLLVSQVLSLLLQNQIAEYPDKFKDFIISYLPAHKIVSSVGVNVKNFREGNLDKKGIKSVNSIPLVGKLYANWFGYNRNSRKYHAHKNNPYRKNNLHNKGLDILDSIRD
jgi:endonuclease YncB( thermonuclease family)